MVTVENLAFGYVPGVSIMRDVSFSVGTGEFIAVGGRNGCGKTTVTRLLMGLEKPQEGKIYYDGKDVTSTPPSAAPRNSARGSRNLKRGTASKKAGKLTDWTPQSVASATVYRV